MLPVTAIEALAAGRAPECVFAGSSHFASVCRKVSSFAMKAARKRQRHPDPAHDLTDLCGVRVVTDTEEEVRRVCRWVRSHFLIDEANSGNRKRCSAQPNSRTFRCTSSCNSLPLRRRRKCCGGILEAADRDFGAILSNLEDYSTTNGAFLDRDRIETAIDVFDLVSANETRREERRRLAVRRAGLLSNLPTRRC
jgi:hypothetical protein